MSANFIRSIPRPACRMRQSIITRGALAGGLAALVATATHAQLKSWNAGAGNWSVEGNWSPSGVPLLNDHVLIGDLPGIQNSTVSLNMNPFVASLAITDGMWLQTTGGQLVVTGPTTVSGTNKIDVNTFRSSELRVVDGPAATDAILGDLTVSDSGAVSLFGGVVQVQGLFTITAPGGVRGTGGTILLTSNAPVAMLVDGPLSFGSEGLTITQLGAGRIDLDGSVAGDRTLGITGFGPNGFDHLTINGTGLADPMDDDVSIGRGNELVMNLSEGWTLGPAAQLRFSGTASDAPPGLLSGSTFTLNGALSLPNSSSWGWFSAPVILNPGSTGSLVAGARLEFNSITTLHDTSITTANTSFNGFVAFNGTTTYDGTMTLGGSVRQTGAATVAGPTTINAGRFDMDGTNDTVWTINDALTINALGIDEFNNVFDGTMTIAGPSSARLTLNLDSPTASWSVGDAPAKLALASNGPMTTRIAGSPLRIFGLLEVTNAVRIEADTRLELGSEVSFTTPTSRLRLSGESLLAGGSFVGGGRLENQLGATLRMAQGTSLGTTDLLNEGTLRVGGAVGTGPGVAFMNNALFDLGSVFVVELGGPVPAFEHDQLQLFGPQNFLAGVLDVRLINLGNGLFTPSVGESFAILHAPPSSIAGGFEDGPISHAPNATYVWSVTQETSRFNDTVSITVADIIPCPGDLNGDGFVDGAELGLMLAGWGACDDCLADLDDDGFVDGGDLGLLLTSWGACPTR